MRFIDEYRDPEAILRVLSSIRNRAGRPRRIMEVCGGQTHAILEHGLDAHLEGSVELLHGPGCPVCVTPIETIDRALELALRPEVTLVSFGDMIRVPGSTHELATARARGADVRVVYSPLDAARLAQRLPDRQIVFLAVGFETTVPAVAGTLRIARQRGLRNFSVLLAHVRVPPAIDAICASRGSRVDAFLAAGHVCSVMGTREYEGIAKRHRVPIIATGFEPLDLAQGIAMALDQLARNEARVEIQYARAVAPEGNPHARALIAEVFRIVDAPWRGMGIMPDGGFALSAAYAEFDAEERFPGLGPDRAAEPQACRAGEVLRGEIKPIECSAFAGSCTPDRPLGAPMVSAEGACAAYFRYRGVPIAGATERAP